MTGLCCNSDLVRDVLLRAAVREGWSVANGRPISSGSTTHVVYGTPSFHVQAALQPQPGPTSCCL